MAAKFLSPSCLSSFITQPSQSKPRSHFRCIHQEPWLGQGRASRPRGPVVCLSLHDPLSSSSPAEVFSIAENAGYSLASYYTSLGLFVISVPGLWSLIKRSVKSKIVQKTFIGDEKKAPNQAAGEILSFFTRNNFVVLDRGETVTIQGHTYNAAAFIAMALVSTTFSLLLEGLGVELVLRSATNFKEFGDRKEGKGIMVPNRGQAALLTFCTCISLASVALVLTITFPEGGNNWYWLTILSPLAGAYYWKRASRKEQIKVKMLVGDDGRLSEVIVQGDDQQVEQMRKELQLSEKGMVYVKGIFER